MDITLIVMLIYVGLSEAKRDYIIEITACNYTKYTNLIDNVHIEIHKYKGLSMTYVEFMLNQKVSRFTVHATFDMLRKDNTKINIMNLDMNGCKFLEAAYSNSIVLIGIRELKRVSNLPKKCPLMAHKKYIINNYTVDPEDYPQYMPVMSWILKLQLRFAGKHQGDYIVKGNVHKRDK